jgi:hypothetical protein
MNPIPSDIYKSMILSNPSIHKWRMDCLFTIFFDSKSPFSFSADGHIVPAFDLKPNKAMNHDPKPYAKTLKGSKLSKKEISIRKEYEQKLCLFIEANIDEISKSPAHFNERHRSYDNNYPASVITKDSLFFNLPKKVAPVWIEELKFIAQNGSAALWKEFCGEYGATDDDTIWTSQEAHDLHRKIWSIVKQLEKA